MSHITRAICEAVEISLLRSAVTSSATRKDDRVSQLTFEREQRQLAERLALEVMKRIDGDVWPITASHCCLARQIGIGELWTLADHSNYTETLHNSRQGRAIKRLVRLFASRWFS